MADKVIFHLAKHFPPLNPAWAGSHELPEPETLYEQIKSGKKRSEWRDFSKYWLYRLCKPTNPNVLILYINVNGTSPQDISSWLKVHRAWLVQGYPKGSLPRLEAAITGLVFHPNSSQLETKFNNVKEVTEFRCGFPSVASCPSCSDKDQTNCASPSNEESNSP